MTAYSLPGIAVQGRILAAIVNALCVRETKEISIPRDHERVGQEGKLVDRHLRSWRSLKAEKCLCIVFMTKYYLLRACKLPLCE